MKRKIGLIAISLLLFACEEKTQVNQISGKLYQNCEREIFSDTEIALKTNIGGSFNDPIILSSATTDADGNFSFTYEMGAEETGTGDLLLIQESGFETLLREVKLNLDLSFSLYSNNKSQVEIILSGSRNFDNDDTLFIGLDVGSVEKNYIQPTNGILDTFKTAALSTYNKSSSGNIYFGIGKKDFLVSKEALGIQDSSYHNRNVKLNGCESTTALDITIN